MENVTVANTQPVTCTLSKSMHQCHTIINTESSSDITDILSGQLNINIRKLTISTQDGIFDGEIQLGVHDVEDVRTICNKLKNMQGIEEVTRID